ncbi:uncharacterized protein [Triticum aestivum]|uniref:uncharacterized protein n=1 Tax=Triticum aestivum TaxID=4565 RepID=UPI001D018046|nr:uncharacterized protein LOC123128461 [Triticum aestivum]
MKTPVKKPRSSSQKDHVLLVPSTPSPPPSSPSGGASSLFPTASRIVPPLLLSSGAATGWLLLLSSGSGAAAIEEHGLELSEEEVVCGHAGEEGSLPLNATVLSSSAFAARRGRYVRRIHELGAICPVRRRPPPLPQRVGALFTCVFAASSVPAVDATTSCLYKSSRRTALGRTSRVFEREGWKRGGWSERRRGRNRTTCYFFVIDVIPPLYRFSWMTCGPYSRPLSSISVGRAGWSANFPDASSGFGSIGLRGDYAQILMQFRSDQHKWQQVVVEKA